MIELAAIMLIIALAWLIVAVLSLIGRVTVVDARYSATTPRPRCKHCGTVGEHDCPHDIAMD